MVSKIMAQKKGMRQVWTATGKRLPVTQLMISGNVIVRTEAAAEGATEVTAHMAFGDKKLANTNRAQASLLSKIGLTIGKRRFFESQAPADIEAGREIKVEEMFQPGDVVKITGQTKGTGFTGVVKRWNFSGGPKTHGQSDRQRAPGSIGAGTVPGHVWKGKHMAGRDGSLTKTLETVQIVAVNPADQSIWIRGTLPGSFNSLMTIRKNGSASVQELTAESRQSLGLVDAAPAVEAEAAAVTEEATV